MRIEAFSEGKDPARPDANEDRFVLLPGRAFAVIDGVSARLPALYDGKLSGHFAAELVARTLEATLADGPLPDGRALVRQLTQTIADAYARFGMADQVRDDPNPRFAATLALVLLRPDALEIVLVGDSGVRIGGTRLFQVEKELDGITATLRRSAWHRAAARTADPAERERLSRQVVLHGTRQGSVLDAADLRAIEADAAAASIARYPHLPRDLVLRLLHGGILNEQKAHQNAGASPLGYSCLDGFPIPEHLVTVAQLPRAGLDIELFTDGYFAPAPGFGLAAWEAQFDAIEAEDPAKIGRYASVKGSLGGVRADDRTYVGVRGAGMPPV